MSTLHSHGARLVERLTHPPRVADLLAEHRGAVDAAKARVVAAVEALKDADVAKAASEAPVDDLWVLRFVLSAPKNDVEVAVKNAVATLQWRAKHAEDLALARQGKPRYVDEMNKYSKVDFVGYLGIHPVIVVRAGRGDTKAMMDNMTEEQVSHALMMQTERFHHMCDVKTRETGLLSKQLGVVDLEGMSLWKFDRRFPRAQGKASHESAVHYPQLLGLNTIINAPTFFSMIFSVFRVFMPQSTLDKQAFCPAHTLKQSATTCPFLSRFSPHGADMFPKFLGGNAPCPASLVLEGEGRVN